MLSRNLHHHHSLADIPYEITIFTGDVKDAGTDCQMTMTLYGNEGATPEISLEKGEEKFERGTVDMFRMELEDIGKLSKLRIGHDGKGNRPSWHLDKVTVCGAHCVSC